MALSHKWIAVARSISPQRQIAMHIAIAQGKHRGSSAVHQKFVAAGYGF
ncbi:hypothetical protein FHX08_001392 [Rhizobium sp. BK529]|nr:MULTISPECIES: hypothetical protein [unclassified Rhizobium]MBB3591048.1 hypothetical protein [Rhizobium sp. BK529]